MTTNNATAADTEDSQTIMLSDILRAMKRFAWLFLLLTALGGVLAYIWAKRQTKLYDATASIHVEQHGTFSLSSALGSSDDYDLKVQTEILYLQSYDLAMGVIGKLHLERNRAFNPSMPALTNLNDPAVRNALYGIFSGSLDIERVPKTEVITVTYRNRDPLLSALIANKVVDTYIEQNLQNHYRDAQNISTWLTSDLDGLRNKSSQEQSELLNLGAKLGIYGDSEQNQSSLYVGQVAGLLNSMVKAQTQEYFAHAESEALKANPDALASADTPGIIPLYQMTTQLSTIEAQRKSMASRYGPGYKPLAELEAQEDQLRKNLQAQRDSINASAKASYETAKSTEANIQAQMDTLKSQAKGMTSDMVHYQQLKSQYTADEMLYNAMLTMLSTGTIQAGLKTQDLGRMGTAEIPSMPSVPKTAQITLAGAAIGLLLAALIAFGRTIASDTVETVEHIEEILGLPVLATVPVYKLDAPDPTAPVAPLATINAPRSSGAEAYRILRTAISLMPAPEKGGRVISLTSCGPGEGKSTTILNLAVVFSQQNKRVLLIDADQRKPALSQRLKLPSASAPGLSRFLSDPSIRPEDCVQRIETIPGLAVIPVQDVPAFPSELLGQGRLEELVSWARAHYDIILFDTPPALLVTDALLVANLSDVILLVARIGVAQRRALRRLRTELTKFAGKHLAIVVNAVPSSQSYYGGYGGYHGYYGSEKAN